MSEQPTCGEGLAAHAGLPSKLGELLTAVADVLEVHIHALDLTDERSRKEYEAYRDLARAHRLIGGQLTAMGERMMGYRDLPMGRHDMRMMGAAAARDAFRQFVEREQELVALLQLRLPQDRQMLEEMGRPR